MRLYLIAILVVLISGCTRGTNTDPAISRDNVLQLASQRAVTADRWVVTLVERRDAGEPMNAQFVSTLIEAAKARAIAHADAATDIGGKQSAYAAYRDFCGEQLAFMLRQSEPVPPSIAAQLRYAMADAEWRMGYAAYDAVEK